MRRRNANGPTIVDINLTDVDPNHARSMPGMAHFAGTGPVGTRCGYCVFWGDLHKGFGKRDCRKYYELTAKHGPDIPAVLQSCKYFKKNPSLK